jgi:hypothetical protein
MSRRRETELESLLRELTPAARKLVQALRRVIRETVPTAEESVLWGGISYHRPLVGGRVKGAVCLINLTHDAVRSFRHGMTITSCQCTKGRICP